MIVFNDVPINCCAIGIVGLPHSGMSESLNSVFKHAMTNEAYKIMKKEVDRCFNMYDMCMFGAYPYKKFKWSHATKRFSPVFFILSDLVRLMTLRNLDYEQLQFTPLDAEASSIFGDDFLDKHFRFLYTECEKMHQQMIKPGEVHGVNKALFLEGLSLFTVFDIGLSKAVYDFLPLFAFCFKKLVRFAHYSIDRDINKFNEPPDLSQEKYQHLPERYQILQHFPRSNYLLQLASGGYNADYQGDAFSTMMIGTYSGEIGDPDRVRQFQQSAMAKASEMKIENTIDNEWVKLDVKNEESVSDFQKRIEEKIKVNNRLHISIPLKWVFLRSLIASLTISTPGQSAHIIISFNAISHLAKKLDMNDEDVKRFLTTFTDFGSLLYCAVYESLAKYVITDIEAFMLLLNILYHPTPEHDEDGLILKYGIVLEKPARKIFGDIYKKVMEILVSLGLAAKLAHNQLVIDGQSFPNESHFMPNVRKGAFDTSICQGSLIIRFITANRSENEAILSKSILARHPSSKVKLIASENVNCTKLRITLDPNTSFEIHILYHGKEFELRLVGIPNEMPPPSHSIITTCTTIIEGCCKGLINEANFKQGVDFSVGFRCLTSRECHYVPNDTGLHLRECRECQSLLSGNTDEGIKMQWWIAALKKV